MGLFGKKRTEEPEVTDLTAEDLDKEPSAGPGVDSTEQAEDQSAPDREVAMGPGQESGMEPSPPQTPIPLMSKKTPIENYGFAQVRDLMRTIPLAENRELVVKVVKKTLESANISLAAIIDDAKGMQEEAKTEIDAKKQTISNLQDEIANYKKEVADLERGLSEITRIKDLLDLAENLESRATENGRAEEKSPSDRKTRSSIPPAKAYYKSQSFGQKK